MNDEQPATPQVVLQEKLIAVRLNCSYSFGRVTDRKINAEIAADKGTDAVTARKVLFPKESGKYLRALTATLATFYAYHKKVTMEGINDGERLLPVVFYPDYMHEFGAYEVLVKESFEEFKANYQNSLLQAPNELKGAYNANDYPREEDLHRHLNFHLRTLPLPVATPLLTAVGSSIQSDVDGYLNDAMKSALTDVNCRVKDALQRMVDVLSNPKGRVHDTMVESLAELVSFIPSFNITADDSLNLLAEEVKTRLLVPTEVLRTDVVARQATADAAFDILRRMGAKATAFTCPSTFSLRATSLTTCGKC